MGEAYQSKRKSARIYDLHVALRKVADETGTSRRLIPTASWEAIIVRCLGEMTRQSVQDTTYAMDRLGMIRRVPRKGVYLVNHEVAVAPDELRSQSGLTVAAT